MSRRSGPIELDQIPDPDVREEWNHLRLFKIPDESIAGRLGIAWETVESWQRRTPAEVRRVTVRRLFDAGLNDAQIATECRVTQTTVQRDRLALGLHRPVGGSQSPEAIAERRTKVAGMSAAGYSNREIARSLGVSRTTVDEDRRALVKAGQLR